MELDFSKLIFQKSSTDQQGSCRDLLVAVKDKPSLTYKKKFTQIQHNLIVVRIVIRQDFHDLSVPLFSMYAVSKGSDSICLKFRQIVSCECRAPRSRCRQKHKITKYIRTISS